MKFQIFLFMFITSLIGGCKEAPPILGPSIPSPDFFDVEIGKRFPVESDFKPENKSIPVWLTRVPLPENSELDFIKDYNVNIDKASEMVSYIGFERAFNTLQQCIDALETVKILANDRLGFELSENTSAPLSETIEDIEADIYCGFKEGSPYHTLYVSFRSVFLFKKQLEKFKS